MTRIGKILKENQKSGFDRTHFELERLRTHTLMGYSVPILTTCHDIPPFSSMSDLGGSLSPTDC